VNSLIPLSVAVPMVVAAVLVAISPLLPRRLVDSITIATAGSVLAMCVLVMFRSASMPSVYWFGGWTPSAGHAIGICFVADPVSAGLAALIAGLVLASMVFAWRYFEEVGTLFHALMMIFLAAMVGFSWTGDLFNLFVFFELMSVVAYALTGYKIEEESALEGAINFGVTNSVGALFVLLGIALLYGRAGALNMAEIGRILAAHPPDGLVICAFTFIAAGFLVKAAMLPFHFWLSDAHAVAPTPVCVLFSGVMVELGLYAVVRVYWTIFSGIPQFSAAFHTVLLGFGVATAVVGAVMCLLQRHLKRLLAFSTISHMGLFACGVALLGPVGLAGAAIYVVGHGLVKGALFICSGIVLNETGSVDEIALSSHPVASPFTIIVYAAAALGLAGLPPFCTAAGKSLIEHAAHGWEARLIEVVMVFASALTAAAVLRAGGRIFFGWGTPPGEEQKAPTEEETEPEIPGRRLLPSVMLPPAAALVALAILIGITPSLAHYVVSASARLEDRKGYLAQVLEGHASQVTAPPAPEISQTSNFIAVGLAIAIALFALFSKGLPRRVRAVIDPAIDALHQIHSGAIADYIAWLVVGVAAFGLALNFLL
jgi:multicomponent Na+:H+ antiporter subunit D